MYDDTASIGKLYRRQDEIGTPFCVTVDPESLDDGAATIRERDSMTQERVALDLVPQRVADLVAGRATVGGRAARGARSPNDRASADAKEGVVALLRAHDAPSRPVTRCLAALFCEDARISCSYKRGDRGSRGRSETLALASSRRFDTSAWAPDPELIEVRGDRAYAFSTYTERLARPRGDGPRISCAAGSSVRCGASRTAPGGSRCS